MSVRINRHIQAMEVRLISESDDEMGVHSILAALNLAKSRDEDLIEVDPHATPPLCQVIDYGKFQCRQRQNMKARQHD